MDDMFINPNNKPENPGQSPVANTPPVNNSTVPGQTFGPGSSTEPQQHFGAQEPKKRKSRKRLIILIVVLLAALGAGAYYLISNSLKETTTQSETELAEVEQIRIGSIDGPANNIFPKEGLGVSYSQSRQIYEGLVGEQDKKYVPLLAESWTNPDEKTWVFKLKSNVKFHTGKTVTATDVKSSIDAIKKLDFLGYVHSTIASVEVVSDSEVKIITTEPDALLLNRLALAFISDQEAADKEGNNGTGPYKLDTSAKYDENTATMIANDDYHRGRPKTRKLIYTIYENDEKMNTAMKAGELELMDTIPDDKAIAGLDEAGFSKVNFEAPGTFGLYLNLLRDDSPLKNKDFRSAIAQAMDRKSLVEELDNNNQPASQIVPKSLPGYDASLSFPEFNLEAAKAALQKSGLASKTLEYLYAGEVQPDPPVIIKQLEAAGLKIKPVNFNNPDELLDKVFAGEFDLFSAAYTSDLADSRDLLGALLKSSEASYPVLNDPDFDSILEESDQELDPTKRIALLQKANKYATDNLLWIPIRSTVYVSYYKPELSISHDFNGGGTLGVYYWQVGQKVSN